ncbi:MAG: flagellar export chaperone FliS [Planctomycetes bacterium]|nr:flagellar export chaperone FliS [Planctomycetota bacterium]
MQPDLANPYLRNSVLTASPEQLQLMLYDGAIRFARQGKDALVANDFETSYERLSRAQAIIIEMEAGLRHEVNPELCERMAAIYGFLYRKLVEASVRKDPSAIDDALKILDIERETWVLLIEKVQAARADGNGPAPSADPTAQRPVLEATQADLPQHRPGTLCIEG